jgi:hypothetical protein
VAPENDPVAKPWAPANVAAKITRFGAANPNFEYKSFTAPSDLTFGMSRPNNGMNQFILFDGKRQVTSNLAFNNTEVTELVLMLALLQKCYILIGDMVRRT